MLSQYRAQSLPWRHSHTFRHWVWVLAGPPQARICVWFLLWLCAHVAVAVTRKAAAQSTAPAACANMVFPPKTFEIYYNDQEHEDRDHNECKAEGKLGDIVAENIHCGPCASSWIRLGRAVRSAVSSAMLDYLIVLCVGAAGLWERRWWLILVGTLGLCIGSFADKWGNAPGPPIGSIRPEDSIILLGERFHLAHRCSASYLIGTALALRGSIFGNLAADLLFPPHGAAGQ